MKHTTSARVTMHCFNCDNVERFVLGIECTIEYDTSGLRDPDWRVTAQCLRCRSDDVAGSPVAVLARGR